MPMTMLEKPTNSRTKAQWPAEIRAEFEQGARNPNGCVGQQLISEN